MSKVSNIGVIIPVFKNKETIIQLCQELNNLEKSLQGIKVNLVVTFVIDGTPDDSELILIKEKSKLEKRNWQIVTLSRNFGQINAILAGLSVTTANAYVCMSADLQDPPNLILNMVEKYRQGNPIVIAARNSRSDKKVAQLTSRIAYYFLRREMPSIPKGGFDFFLISEEIKQELLKMEGVKRFLQGDVVSLGFSPAVIRYHRNARLFGESSYSIVSRFRLFLDFIIDVSSKPLRIVSVAGVITSLSGFVMACLSIVTYLQGNAVARGFTPIYVGILIFGGLQLLSIGILGEYVLRIYDMQRRRPTWVIKSIK